MTYTARGYPGFRSISATRSVSTDSPHPWMGLQPQGSLPALVCLFPFTSIHLGGERHCESKISCPRKAAQTLKTATAQTRTDLEIPIRSPATVREKSGKNKHFLR